MTVPTEVSIDLQLSHEQQQLFIGGAFCDARDGATFDVLAPAHGQVVATVSAAGSADVDAAVRAARSQARGGAWSRLAGADRGRLLHRLADLLERDLARVARLEAVDIGRPISEPTYGDLPSAIDVLRHFAGWADKVTGQTIPLPPAFGRSRHGYTLRQPIGVVGAITAWNAPTLMATWKLAPALAAGNAVVLKPAEDAPLSSLHLATLVAEAGFPEGTINIVPGLGEVAGAALVAHPGVDKLTFTGSPEVGREVAVQAARSLKRVTLELGGKSPQIVLGDVDPALVAPAVAAGFLTNQGEICAAGTRVFVAREIFDEVTAGVAAAARAVRVGDPLDPDTTMGSLINARQRDRVMSYIERGRSEGAELVTGGTRPDRPGFFVEPTVFAGGGNATTIAREEIFGPVGLMLPYDDVEEALRQANETEYGLAAYVWTNDLSAALRLADGLDAGSVWINGPGIPDPRMPWGGRKISGIGRELGWAGIEENTDEKSVVISL